MPRGFLNTENTTVGAPYDLLAAVSYGDLKTVHMHIANPWYNINQKDNDNNTALMIACHYDHVQIVRTLLRTPGIDANMRNIIDTDALIMAVSKGHSKIVKILIEAGIYKGIKKYSITPLMHACFFGHCDIIDILLKEKGALINYRNSTGHYAMSFAIKGLCKGNDLGIVMTILKKLLNAGANPFCQSIEQHKQDIYKHNGQISCIIQDHKMNVLKDIPICNDILMTIANDY